MSHIIYDKWGIQCPIRLKDIHLLISEISENQLCVTITIRDYVLFRRIWLHILLNVETKLSKLPNNGICSKFF